MGDLAVPRPRLQAGPGDGHLPQRVVERLGARLAGVAVAGREHPARRDGRGARAGARALAQFRAVDRPGDREPQGRPAPRLFGDGGGRAIDAEPARPDARADAGRIAADGSGDPRQDARLRRRMEAGHRGHGLARDHALSRLHPGRVHSARAQVGLARGHAGRPLVLSRPDLLRRRPWMPTRWSCSTSRRSRWRTSAKSRSASAASCSATG